VDIGRSHSQSHKGIPRFFATPFSDIHHRDIPRFVATPLSHIYVPATYSPSKTIAALLHPCSRGIQYILYISRSRTPVLHGIRPSVAKKKAP